MKKNKKQKEMKGKLQDSWKEGRREKVRKWRSNKKIS